MSDGNDNTHDQRDLSIQAIEDVLAAVHAAAVMAEQFLAHPTSASDGTFAFRKSQAEVAVSVLQAAPAVIGSLINVDNHGSISSRLRADSRWNRPAKT